MASPCVREVMMIYLLLIELSLLLCPAVQDDGDSMVEYYTFTTTTTTTNGH